MATNVVIPAMGESITEAVLVRWIKSDGESVRADEPLCELETDKANLDLPAPASGVLHTAKGEGESVRVGDTIGRIDDAQPGPAQKKDSKEPAKTRAEPPVEKRKTTGAAGAPAAKPDAKPAEKVAGEQAAEPESKADEPDRKEEERPPKSGAVPKSSIEPDAHQGTPPTADRGYDEQGIRRVPMTKIRSRIAERLVAAKRQTAMLTTFNEVDMSAVLDLRIKYKARFEESHGVSLGLMSFFAAATTAALRDFPMLNAQIDGGDILYHQHVNLGIAVSTERGLVVPVIPSVDTMSFGRIEGEIKRVALAARDGKLGLAELGGGTFTITNGGTFGSLLSTPILNPPQTGILGMHTIQKRPIAVDDRVEVRPMMYLALTYDHRLVDGSDSVRFLVRIKELIEDPARLLLQI